jgi:hypothetical protein
MSSGNLIYFILSGGETESLGTAATTGLLCQPRMIVDGDCGEIGGIKIGKGNRSTRRKNCPSAALSTTDPTWLDSGLNPGRRCGEPATNRLSYGAAHYDISCQVAGSNPGEVIGFFFFQFT